MNIKIDSLVVRDIWGQNDIKRSIRIQMQVVYTAIAYAVSNEKTISTSELSNITRLSRSTVLRVVKRLINLGFLSRTVGGIISNGHTVKQNPTKYFLLIKVEYEKFKKKIGESISGLKQFLGKSFGVGPKKRYCCKECGENKVKWNGKSKWAYCNKCEKGFHENGVPWYGYKKFKFAYERMCGREVKLYMIP